MTPPNFNWFLHAMLFYHSARVIKKQEAKKEKEKSKSKGKDDGNDSESDKEDE